MRSILLLCVGLTSCSLVASLDDYEFTEQFDTGSDPGKCECSDDAEACCDGCHFESAQQSCANTEELKCSQTTCGGAVERREGEQFCSGKSASCDGEVAWMQWERVKECGDFAACRVSEEGAGAHCVGDLKCASWIHIDGAPFEMGSGFPKESPIHSVSPRSFEMMQTEVTVAQWAECENEGICARPTEEDGCNFIMADFENHPMNCVSHDQAKNFCTWAGGRLASESEWEFAARGNGQAIDYPWGDEAATCERAVIREDGDGCGTGATFPVCSKPKGHTTTELCDMGGNVWEWVEDVWHENYEGAPADGSPWLEPGHDDRTIRGGGLFSPGNDVAVTRREHEKADDQFADVGFRCVRDSNVGDICESDNDCFVDAICPNLGGDEIESHCYISCDKGPQICAGTDTPHCSNIWNIQLCLDEITLAGDFECSINSWSKGNSKATLVVGKDAEEEILDDCTSRKVTTQDGVFWVIQLSKRIGSRQIDALVYWPLNDHQTENPIEIKTMGYVYDDTYDSSGSLIEEKILGFFLNGAGKVQLNVAGSNTGQKVTGSLELIGRVYNATMPI